MNYKNNSSRCLESMSETHINIPTTQSNFDRIYNIFTNRCLKIYTTKYMSQNIFHNRFNETNLVL